MEMIDKANLAWIKLMTMIYSLRDDERGEGGGNSLVAVLLTVAGVVAAGVVIAAIIAVINNNTPQLTQAVSFGLRWPTRVLSTGPGPVDRTHRRCRQQTRDWTRGIVVRAAAAP